MFMMIIANMDVRQESCEESKPESFQGICFSFFFSFFNLLYLYEKVDAS